MIAPVALSVERDRAFAAVEHAIGRIAWPDVPVRWNRRLRRAGRAVIERRRGAVVRATIELSPAYFEVYPDDLAGILIHEGVHVGLALLGLPFGHSPTFRDACERAGGRQHSRNMPGRVYRYRCPVCAAILDRRRRPSGDRWCAVCASDALRRGLAAFEPGRALVLVGLAFQGPERCHPPSPDMRAAAESSRVGISVPAGLLPVPDGPTPVAACVRAADGTLD